MATKIRLSPEEVQELTEARQPAKQLEVLHKMGYWRAWRKHGVVILERAHYEAVCAGAVKDGAAKKNDRPALNL